MRSLLLPLVSLVALACGQVADAELAQPELVPAQALAAEPEPVAAAPSAEPALPEPSPAAAPAAAPAAPAVPAPPAAPAVVPPVVAPPAPAPTPEDPLLVDCADAGCDSCRTSLQTEHPEWYAAGAAMCVWRSCTLSSECSDLGAALVCAPTGGPAGPGLVSVCRAPRVALGHACTVNEVRSTDGHAPVCEPGLWCVPVGNALHLICQPFNP